ncbi:dynein light chain Tctex-type protein 2B isoform X2 [Meriones unguiculatus]|uniref:dynein light chain Tctex-type protein 2B isoform X2 n=1 Tax=Meriones unguiculatus TaxID=10047 RepID=UPI000B4ECF41|nr:tctex1 domain-containing protein 2-like isoform X2 [Meriones unguiculatus]XP_060226208.1 dynein light chain Tctex-type protein 2B isoform X2 [Meriones unguiculatus]
MALASRIPSYSETEIDKNFGDPENTYILRPIFQQRFRPSVVKDCIHAVLKEELANAAYSPDEIPYLTKHLSEVIKDKLKAWLLAVSGMQTRTTTLTMFS